MNNYLCANRHHFRAPTPRCPTPDCNAEVRQTAVNPSHGRAPAFEKLPRPSAAPAPETTPDDVKHSFKWWSNGVRWAKDTADNDAVSATCVCGWGSPVGSLKEVKKLVKDHKG